MNPLIDVVVLTALLIALFHWFPWQRATGHSLPRLIAYMLGVAVILGAPTAAYWRWAPAHGADVLRLFLAAGATAGLVTFMAWAVDALIEAAARRADLEDARDERAQRLD